MTKIERYSEPVSQSQAHALPTAHIPTTALPVHTQDHHDGLPCYLRVPIVPVASRTMVFHRDDRQIGPYVGCCGFLHSDVLLFRGSAMIRRMSRSVMSESVCIVRDDKSRGYDARAPHSYY
jgi:hypothetical protein